MPSSTLLTNRRKPRETTKSVKKPKKAAMSSQSGAPVSGCAIEPQVGPRFPFRGVGGQHGDDVVDAAGDAVAEIARLEPRRDGVGDDHLRQRVGQRAFEAVADLDPHATLVRRHQQQDAVVLVRLAQLPGAEQLVGVGLDLLPFQRADGGDDELDAGLVLEIRELRLDRGLRRRREDAGLIDDAAGERRKGQRRRDASRRRRARRRTGACPSGRARGRRCASSGPSRSGHRIRTSPREASARRRWR